MTSTSTEFGCPTETLPVDIRRILWSSVIGASIEWYDFLVYAAATALVFNQLFFPTLNAHLGSIAAFGAYAAGFLARPVGALIFGHFGDRIGRKPMLITTMLIMGCRNVPNRPTADILPSRHCGTRSPGCAQGRCRALGSAANGRRQCSWHSKTHPQNGAVYMSSMHPNGKS